MADTDDTLLLTAYVDGELSPDAARRLETRLDLDPVLRARERRLRGAVAAVEALPTPQPSAGLRDKVLAAVATPSLAERVGAWLTLPRVAPVGLALAAAGAAVVLWPRDADGDDEEQVFLAQNLDLVEDLDVLGLDTADDLEVIASLHELELQR
jgi:anti-sigma factor RsiW